MNMGVRDIGADYFPESADAENFFHMFGKFFDGGHEGVVIFFWQIINFVYFILGDYQRVTFSFWMNIKKSESFVVFVDFIAWYFAINDAGKNARHEVLSPFWIFWV